MTEQQNIPPPPASSGFQFNGPTLVSALYLATYFTVFTAIVGVILAYVWRRHAVPEWERSHYVYLIRTFWLGIGGYLVAGGAIIAAILAFDVDPHPGSEAVIGALIVGGLAILVLTVMLVARCAMSLVNAQQNLPMPRPQSWTI